MRILLLIGFLLSISGCDAIHTCATDCSPVPANPIKLSPNSIQNDAKIQIVDRLISDNLPSDAAGIGSAVLSGHWLTLQVSTGGGCRVHTWGLVGTPAIAKSMPPQNTIRLTHNANGDLCDALIYETLTFDLSPLAKVLKPTQEVILNIALPDGNGMFVTQTPIVFKP